MPLQNVTYGTLINSIATTIADSCVNLNNDRYNAMVQSLKGGTFVNNSYGSRDYIGRITMTSSNAIPNLTNDRNRDTVINDVKNNIKNYVVSGSSTRLTTIYPDNENISMPKFISFFNNIVSFCYGSMEFVSGSVTDINGSGANIKGDAYLAYKSSIDNTYKYDVAPDALIRAKSTNEVITVLKTELKRTLRSKSITYTWGFA